MDKLMVAIAAFYGMSGVAMGAFAAHALKKRLDDYALDIIQTATQYQMIHAIAMLAIVALAHAGSFELRTPLWCFVIGVALFSGSLYALALTGIKPLGAITPIGGALLLLGWIVLIVKALKVASSI
ncbi:MAG: DUF423 domain-containing protein [Oceanococcus sp.]|nr:MAG: DUF423 domain-containing protein [Oceanococcus sp.]